MKNKVYSQVLGMLRILESDQILLKIPICMHEYAFLKPCPYLHANGE